tara:strand:- start:904 stop:1500 length:597 start_codon:yes stop_codon:yes gene_type:complete
MSTPQTGSYIETPSELEPLILGKDIFVSQIFSSAGTLWEPPNQSIPTTLNQSFGVIGIDMEADVASCRKVFPDRNFTEGGHYCDFIDHFVTLESTDECTAGCSTFCSDRTQVCNGEDCIPCEQMCQTLCQNGDHGGSAIANGRIYVSNTSNTDINNCSSLPNCDFDNGVYTIKYSIGSMDSYAGSGHKMVMRFDTTTS